MRRHSIKSWSKTQASVAVSSGESELYATLKAAAETLGMLSIMKDLGWNISGEIWRDASAALGTINRRGLGNTRDWVILPLLTTVYYCVTQTRK